MDAIVSWLTTLIPQMTEPVARLIVHLVYAAVLSFVAPVVVVVELEDSPFDESSVVVVVELSVVVVDELDVVLEVPGVELERAKNVPVRLPVVGVTELLMLTVTAPPKVEVMLLWVRVM